MLIRQDHIDISRLAVTIADTAVFRSPSPVTKTKFSIPRKSLLGVTWRKQFGSFCEVAYIPEDVGADETWPETWYIASSSLERLPFDAANTDICPSGFVEVEDLFVRDRRNYVNHPIPFSRVPGEWELITDKLGRTLRGRGYSNEETSRLGISMHLRKDKTFSFRTDEVNILGGFTYNPDEQRFLFLDKIGKKMVLSKHLSKGYIQTDGNDLWLETSVDGKEIMLKRISP